MNDMQKQCNQIIEQLKQEIHKRQEKLSQNARRNKVWQGKYRY